MRIFGHRCHFYRSSYGHYYWMPYIHLNGDYKEIGWIVWVLTMSKH